MDSFDSLAKAGIARTPRVIEVETAVARHLESVWDQPSADIWEGRGAQALHLFPGHGLGRDRSLPHGWRAGAAQDPERRRAGRGRLSCLLVLTHLGVVNTALFLSGPVVQRAGG